jgi:hypothetical protein
MGSGPSVSGPDLEALMDRMRERARVVGRAVGTAALGVLSLSFVDAARATGVDGAGRIVIVPVVVSGDTRESVITITNAGTEDLRMRGTFVGAEGTQTAASVVGPIPCTQPVVPADGSLTLPLRDLCPGVLVDGESFGYLELISSADAHLNFFVTTDIETRNSTHSAVAGQPIGAFDTATPGAGLEVAALRTQKADEQLFCYVASLEEGKKVALELRDAAGTSLGTRSFNLAARRMERVELPSALNLPKLDRDALRVAVMSGDTALVIAGCGAFRPATNVLAYQHAQALAPADRARLRSVDVETGLRPGPWPVGYTWNHPLFPGGLDNVVALSTYLRSDDQVRCRIVKWSVQSFDATPWLDLRIKDPNGTVVAGGKGVKDTGTFDTRSRGVYPPGTTQRYQIEIGFDEVAHASNPWPQVGFPSQPAPWGGWALHCDSAAGMSEPAPINTLITDF